MSKLAEHNYSMSQTKPSPTIPGVSHNEFEVTVYPNPVHEDLKVRIFPKEAGIFDVSLFDVTGRLLSTVKIPDSTEEIISMRDKPSGIYLLETRDKNGNRVTAKIIKQ